MSTAEGAAFAERMGSLFVEASAKTAVGVQEAFTDGVSRILDTPELWAPVSSVTPDSHTRNKERAPQAQSMPGGDIDLSASNAAADAGGGCAC